MMVCDCVCDHACVYVTIVCVCDRVCVYVTMRVCM